MANSTTKDVASMASMQDNKFFSTIFKYLPKTAKDVNIDWQGFAVEMGLKDASIAKCRYAQIRKKFGMNETASKTTAKASTPSIPPYKVTKSRKTMETKNFKLTRGDYHDGNRE
ncbi:hypothetical protein F5B20DRAFT_576623 [Whalleya microplaca]|nr:hypothetical protein F5B20DRAFT_576623 [Whalleya microplaca]